MTNVCSVSPGSLTWQGSLLALATATAPRLDHGFASAVRHDFGRGAWVDHVGGWLDGAEELFAELVTRIPWQHRTVTMYGNVVPEPRLTAWFDAPPRDLDVPEVIVRAADSLTERYERDFDSLGMALYRDGRDSVAWHGDRIPFHIVDPIVAICSLGSPRDLHLRPKGGGRSRKFRLHSGDLVVMGGTSQRTWEHCVPKVAHAGPRLSVMFRHSR